MAEFLIPDFFNGVAHKIVFALNSKFLFLDLLLPTFIRNSSRLIFPGKTEHFLRTMFTYCNKVKYRGYAISFVA
jgi:hypothetical protein